MIDMYHDDQFDIPGFVWFEQGSGGLSLLRIHNRFADCGIYPCGAHIASFKPRGQKDILWLSPHSAFEKGKPIRGGIPVCFPWFGSHRTRADLPLHGFARTRLWDLKKTAMLPDGKTLVAFALTDNDYTRSLWPHKFNLDFSVTVGSSLEASLLIENRDSIPFMCEEAFHTYFSVENSASCQVTNLDGLEYIDRVRNDARAIQAGAVRIEGELVNAYMRAPAVCELIDTSAHRQIRIEQRGMRAIVVWNPGAKAAAANPEILETWNEFVCVESANCLDHALEIAPGATHRSVVKISADERRESLADRAR
ncbi:MAG: D-hexose-6-phosphate mutarotase [Spirochaetales bacterium]|jgi:D-hexose-6-phosphate mutarotase